MERHLPIDELIDLAEGTRAGSSAPHLDRCDACRHKIAELRAVMSAAGKFEVPDPSPLFWDHLSQRVREAVREEGGPGGGSWFGSWTRIAFPLAAGALAVILLAVLVTMRGGSTQVSSDASAPSSSTMAADLLSSDPSLSFVSDLTVDLDWDGVRDAGFASDGSAEHAVTELSQDELRQLQRLLQTEIGRPSA